MLSGSLVCVPLDVRGFLELATYERGAATVGRPYKQVDEWIGSKQAREAAFKPLRVGRESERKQELLLEPVLSGGEPVQRDKEVWKLPAVAKLTLYKHETL